MSNNLFAHTLSGKPTSEWQPLHHHLAECAKQAERFSSFFYSGEWGKVVGLLHDLGKIDNRFQEKLLFAEKRISKQPKKVNHSGAGAALAEERLGALIGRTLAYLIAGHHAGLPDYFSDKTGKASWSVRKKEAQENLDMIRSQLPSFVLDELPQKLSPPSFLKPENYHLWVRMLFSALVDADWLDTEQFMSPERYATRSTFPPMNELASCFWDYMKDKQEKADQSLIVNRIRNEIFESCCNKAAEETGLFTLTVPTGGGKTLSSMAFALKHAEKHQLRRIIYVIPYTSIIEQTAAVFREIFGNENVVEHHSNVGEELVIKKEDSKEEEEYHPSSLQLACENWDAPIIVTTNVQFFESLYAAKPSRCRKLHNIAQSVVILDEAQMIEPTYLTPCLDVLNHLACRTSYQMSIVLCTATQPAFSELPYSITQLKSTKDIIDNPDQYYQQLRRVDYHLPDDLKTQSSWEQIAENLSNHPQVLCIVNTRKDCRELYELVKKEDSTAIHLSALMCGEHRSNIISQIKTKLKEGITPLRVISTQLVEAGVDLDFPVVYRALAGLDSIVQAAGRCNREGRLIINGVPSLGQVHVFNPTHRSLPVLLRKGEDATVEILRSGKEINFHAPMLYQNYFHCYYGSLNDTGKEMIEQLQPNSPNSHEVGVYFRSAANEFKLIDNNNIPVLVKYEKGGTLIEELRKTGPNRSLMRKLQRYVVNLSRRTVESLLEKGLIINLEVRGKDFDIYYQNFDSLYHPVYGLDILNSTPSCDETII